MFVVLYLINSILTYNLFLSSLIPGIRTWAFLFIFIISSAILSVNYTQSLVWDLSQPLSILVDKWLHRHLHSSCTGGLMKHLEFSLFRLEVPESSWASYSVMEVIILASCSPFLYNNTIDSDPVTPDNHVSMEMSLYKWISTTEAMSSDI